KKAEQGLAISSPPAGYLARGGTWIKDPDVKMRDIIQLVFTRFLEVGTTGALVRAFRKQGLHLPSRFRDGERQWRPATRQRLHRILRNPAYMGAYICGKTSDTESPDPGAEGGSRRRARAHPTLHSYVFSLLRPHCVQVNSAAGAAHLCCRSCPGCAPQTGCSLRGADAGPGLRLPLRARLPSARRHRSA